MQEETVEDIRHHKNGSFFYVSFNSKGNWIWKQQDRSKHSDQIKHFGPIDLKFLIFRAFFHMILYFTKFSQKASSLPKVLVFGFRQKIWISKMMLWVLATILCKTLKYKYWTRNLFDRETILIVTTVLVACLVIIIIIYNFSSPFIKNLAKSCIFLYLIYYKVIIFKYHKKF